MTRPTVVASMIVLACSGCASFTSPGRSTALEDGKSYWFDYDASRRGTLLVVSNGTATDKKIRTCAEPAPDVAFTLTSKIESELKYKDLDAKAKGEVATQALKLADRTQMVMFIREAMFRLCEINMVQPLESKNLTSLYDQILNIALRLGSDKMIEYDIIIAEATLKKAEKELEATQARRKEVADEIARLREDIATAQGKLDQAQGENQANRNALQQKIDELNKALSGKDAEVVSLKKQADEARSAQKVALENLKEKVTETSAAAKKMDSLTKAGEKVLKDAAPVSNSPTGSDPTTSVK